MIVEMGEYKVVCQVSIITDGKDDIIITVDELPNESFDLIFRFTDDNKDTSLHTTMQRVEPRKWEIEIANYKVDSVKKYAFQPAQLKGIEAPIFVSAFMSSVGKAEKCLHKLTVNCLQKKEA